MGIKGYLQWVQEEFPEAFVKPRWASIIVNCIRFLNACSAFW